MNLRAILGLVALLPAAFNISPAAAASGLVVPLCSSDGGGRTVNLPVGNGEIPGKEQPGCCTKACHTGCRKKGAVRQIDTGQ